MFSLIILAFFFIAVPAFAQPGSSMPGYPAGSVCDGTTDDSAAFQAVANSGLIYVPPSSSGCLLNKTITISPPVFIYGVGPKSKLVINASGGGLQVNGSCGAKGDRVTMRDFSLAGNSAPAFGIFLNGVAGYGLDNIDITGFTYGIKGLGAQQGHIHGGVSWGNGTGIYLNDCNNSVSSNGVDISGGRAFGDVAAAIDIEGGAGDVWVHDIHEAVSAYGVIINQTTPYGGYGPIHLSQDHFEDNVSGGVNLLSATLFYTENGDYNAIAIVSANQPSSGHLYVSGNLLNGSVTLGKNITGFFENNIMWGKFINNGGKVSYQNNNTGTIP